MLDVLVDTVSISVLARNIDWEKQNYFRRTVDDGKANSQEWGDSIQ